MNSRGVEEKVNGKDFVLIALSFLALAALVFALPSASLTGPSHTNSATPALTISATDDANAENTPSTMQFSCDGTAYTLMEAFSTATSFDITGCITGDGSKTIDVNVLFSDGNSAVGAATIIYDSTKPTISPVGTPTAWQNANFDMLFALSDNLSGIASKACTSPTISPCTISDANILAISTDGNNAITYTATDNAGNVSDTAIVYALLDKTAPVLSGIPANITQTATGSSGATVTYTNPTATDPVSGSGAVNCTPVSGSTFALGTTTVNCTATDNAGNTATGTFNITVQDTAPPSVTITSPTPAYSTSSTTVNFQYLGYDNESGIKKYYTRLDSEGWVDKGTGTTADYSSLSNGSHTLSVKAIDNADNSSIEYSASFNVSSSVSDNPANQTGKDLTSPVLQWVSPANNSTVKGIVKVKIKATDNDGVKRVLFYQDGTKLDYNIQREGIGNYFIEWKTTGLNDGNHKIRATVYDLSDNTATGEIMLNVSNANTPNTNADANNDSNLQNTNSGSNNLTARAALAAGEKTGNAQKEPPLASNTMIAVIAAAVIALLVIAAFILKRKDSGGNWGNESGLDKMPKIEFGKSRGSQAPSRKFRKPEKAEKPTRLHSGMKYGKGLDVWD